MRFPFLGCLSLALTLAFSSCVPADTTKASIADIETLSAQELYLGLLFDPALSEKPVFEKLKELWKPGHVPMALETLRFSSQGKIQSHVFDILKEKTGKNFGGDFNAWNEWMWNHQYESASEYAEFKSQLYRNIDSKFAPYFSTERKTLIRLDEVVWGGVRQDGIPPLRSPKMLAAEDATYLADSDIVFGIEVDGDVRAYPKRILAWHEMFVDTIKGVPLAGVY